MRSIKQSFLNIDRGELYRSCTNNDEKAWKVVGDKIFYFVRKKFPGLSIEEVEECQGRTVLALIASELKQVRNPSQFLSYVFGVARNKTVDYIREKIRSERIMLVPEKKSPLSQDDLIICKEMVGVIFKELQKLSKKCVDTLRHFFNFCGGRTPCKTIEELAKVLEINPNSFYSRVRRCFDILAEKVDKKRKNMEFFIPEEMQNETLQLMIFELKSEIRK